MGKYYVIGDIHGRIDLLSIALRDWDRKEERLVFLGDYIDYGPNSREVLKEVMALKEKYGAVTLAGNHEVLFNELVSEHKNVRYGHDNWYSGGRENTFESLLGDSFHKDIGIKEASKLIKERHWKELKFLDDLELYHETEKFIFSHAGIDISLKEWKKSSDYHFYGGGGEFFRGTNQTEKLLVFGHYRTGVIRGMDKGRKKSELHQSPFLNDTIWVSKDGTKLGIDGGATFGGYLHAVHLDDKLDDAVVVSVGQDKKKKYSTLQFNKDFNRIKK